MQLIPPTTLTALCIVAATVLGISLPTGAQDRKILSQIEACAKSEMERPDILYCAQKSNITANNRLIAETQSMRAQLSSTCTPSNYEMWRESVGLMDAANDFVGWGIKVGALEQNYWWPEYKQASALVVSIILSVADTALKHKCFDLADDQYRTIIRIYTGSFYDAARQRAGIGIEDVRTARSR